MTANPWGKKQMHALSDGVLRRGIHRFRTALQYLDHSDAEQVRELREGLRVMEQEQARRASPPDGQALQGHDSQGASASIAKEVSETKTSGKDGLPTDVSGPVEIASPSAQGGTAHAPDRRPARTLAKADTGAAPGGAPARDGTLRDGTPGEDAERGAGPASPEGEPFWRLIPQLKGTSSKIVSVISEEGIIRYQSKPVKWLLGYDAETFIGRTLNEFLCPPSKEQAQEALARMAGGKEKFDCWRLQFTTASGGTFWLEGMASNFLRDPRLGGILVYWRELVE